MLKRYKYWLSIVSKIYGISSIQISSRIINNETTASRLLVYAMCLRDSISMEKLAKKIGHDRKGIKIFRIS